ncbi:MAG: permease prefix domain 1-containing protein [Phycisphaerales bacterium]
MKRTKGINPPTSRDAIESWLDVLVSMLNLPPSQRTQVRDELEDHLRSRVDDLLIMGKTEPAAIQTAIHELGETAELAKLISSASRTRTTFRRFAMNATFFVLAGSILTASVSMMMPNASSGVAMPQIMSVESNAAEPEAHRFDERHSFNIVNASTNDKFNAIADAFGLEVRMSSECREQLMLHGVFDHSFDFTGEFTLEEAIRAMKERYQLYLMGIELVHNDRYLEILTDHEYQRSKVEIRAYPIPSWAVTNDDQLQFGMSIEQLISTKHDLDYTTIQPINGSLVVAAPPEIHAEIIDMAAQLKVLAAEMQAKNQARLDHQRLIKEQQLRKLQSEYETAKANYLEANRQLGMLQGEISQLDSQRLRDIRGLSMPTDDAKEKINAQYLPKIDAISMHVAEYRFEVDEAKARFERLQSILIDAEADLILSNLNEPIDAGWEGTSRSTQGTMQTVAIHGPDGVRSGIYQLPEQGHLTVSRLLMAANVQDLSTKVTLKRDGEIKPIGLAGEIISGEIEDTTLIADDQVVISAAQ